MVASCSMPVSVTPEALVAALANTAPSVPFVIQSRYAVRFQSIAAVLVDAIEQVVPRLGWMLSIRGTARHPGECLLEAVSTSEVDHLTRIFHVSKVGSRPGILATGLLPSSAARTWTSRRYPAPRVHFARSISGCMAFVRSTIPLHEDRRSDMRLRQQFAPLDVWRVDARGIELSIDALMPDEGVWTEAVVPRRKLHRVLCLDLHLRVLLAMRAQGLIRI